MSCSCTQPVQRKFLSPKGENYLWHQSMVITFINLRYSVFALGSRAYPHFAAFGHHLNDVMNQLGAESILAVGEGDELSGQEHSFRKWTKDVFDVRALFVCLSVCMSVFVTVSLFLSLSLSLSLTLFHSSNNFHSSFALCDLFSLLSNFLYFSPPCFFSLYKIISLYSYLLC